MKTNFEAMNRLLEKGVAFSCDRRLKEVSEHVKSNSRRLAISWQLRYGLMSVLSIAAHHKEGGVACVGFLNSLNEHK